MVQLVEICELSKANKNAVQSYTLREIYINPKHVVSLREDDNFKRKLNEGTLPAELDNSHRFTRVVLDKGHTGAEIVVVGGPTAIQEKMNGEARELLFG